MRLQTDITETLGVLETAAALRELTAGLIAVTNFDQALTQLVKITREAVPQIAGCGITVLRAGSPAGKAASNVRLADLDGLECGPDSPALSAIRQREMVLADDLTSEHRWPDWTVRARALGVRGVLSAPIDIDDEVVAAISLYDERGTLTASRQLTVMLLAEHAGLLLAAVSDRSRREALARELEGTLTDGEVIGQAIGVIMSQRGCTAPEALEVLRSAAAAISVPLREVAERLVSSVARHRG